jgi:ABC-type transport system substrate-binding protein
MMAHPVGTGPFRLADWRRASRVVLERNPSYREVLYDEEAPADDPRSQAIAQQLRGKPMPFVDRVEFYVVEESQPRWLSYLNGDHDYLDGLPPEYAHTIIPNGVLAPNLARRGIQMDRLPLVDVVLSYFNMEHPVVGGYSPEKVALRRAMALAYDQDTEIRQIRKNQMIKANGQIAPLTYGFDPAFRTEASQSSLPRAKALLDAFGWVDRNGDGWRETPDGQPLSIVYSTGSTALDRQYNELWKKNMTQLGIKMEFDVNQWPEQLKASRAGRLMMWGVAWVADIPDGQAFLELGYSKNKGQANHARFDLPAYDALFDRQKRMPDGPERLAMLRDMQRLFVAFTPYKLHGHRIRTDLTHPWVIGYRRHPYLRAFFQFVDIDTDARAKALG